MNRCEPLGSVAEHQNHYTLVNKLLTKFGVWLSNQNIIQNMGSYRLEQFLGTVPNSSTLSQIKSKNKYIQNFAQHFAQELFEWINLGQNIGLHFGKHFGQA